MSLYQYFRPLALVLLVALLPISTYAQQGSVLARQRAETALNEGRYGEALNILQTIITPETTDVQLFLLRVRAYESREEYQRAIADYQRVLELDSENEMAQAGIQRARSQYTQLTRGDLESLRRVVLANPNNLQYRLQYADVLYESGLYEDATVQYEAYLDRTQGTPDILRRYLISIANYEGDNDRGERIAERYLRFYPTDDDLHMRLGYFRLWQGKYPEAIQAFEQALRLNPRNQEAQLGLEQARSPQVVPPGQPVSQYPIDTLVQDLERDPTQDEKRFQLIDLLIEVGRYFEAQQNLDYFADQYETDTGWQRRNALVEQRLAQGEGTTPTGPTEFVIDRLLRELERNPNQDEKRFQLVREFIRHDRFAEAYDQLQILAERHDTTQRWLQYFDQIDEGFIRTTGTSPIYPADRFTYLLRFDPTDETSRYALVDALVENNRLTEAYDVLTDPVHANPQDPRYLTRLQVITDARARYTRERIATLEAQILTDPNNVEALVELADLYVQTRRSEEALDLYRNAIERQPGDVQLRYAYAQTLAQVGYYDDALQEVDGLLARSPNNPEYQRFYAVTAIANRDIDERAEQYLINVLERTPDDVQILLDLSSFRLAQGRIEDADDLIRRALAVADPQERERIETQSLLIERELLRTEEADQLAILNDARRLAAADMYQEAVERYEEYFEARGRRTRPELKELAQIHTAAGEYVAALSILEALQEQAFEYDIAKEIAKNRYYLEDYSGAIKELEALLQQNPNDFEVRFLLSESYKQLERYEQAQAVYQDVLSTSANAELIEERISDIEVTIGSVAGVSQSAEWRGMDYVGIIVPVAEATLARGSGTNYNRWSQGIMTQVTLPISSILIAGITSHFLSGSRRLIPHSETVGERVNQVYGGGYIDLTPPVVSARASYTNRVSLLAGVFDYEGGRTAGFGEIRYWRQEWGLYTASIGLRATEGSTELWSPAGGEFALRLTQLDLRGSTASVLSDSLMKIGAKLQFNIVQDNFGGVSTTAGSNRGTALELEASYRVLPYIYLGLMYYQLSYRSTVDIYFSPRDYRTITGWLEYEREFTDRWYLRLRGSLGAVARSSGFISRRIDADLIYRFASKLSISISSSIGQSTRSLGNQTIMASDRYDTFVFSGSLYWTL